MSIITQIFELYVRRRDPKDIDYDQPAALLLAFVTIAVSTVVFAGFGIFKSAILAAIGALTIDLAISYGILHMHDKTARFVQMITASMGVAVISYCLILLIGSVPDMAIIRPVIEIWSLYLSIIILRDVLECSFIKAMTITFIIAILSFFVLLQVFGDPVAIEQQQLEALQQRSELLQERDK